VSLTFVERGPPIPRLHRPFQHTSCFGVTIYRGGAEDTRGMTTLPHSLGLGNENAFVFEGQAVTSLGLVAISALRLPALWQGICA